MKIPPLLAAVLAAGLVASPALAQPPAVDFSDKGDYVYLDFNPPGSTAPAVKLACAKARGRVDVAIYDSKTDQTVKLTSGGESEELAGKKATGTRGDYLRTLIFISDKVMGVFHTSGQLTISGQGFNEAMVAGANKAAVDKFFDGCV